MDYKKINNAEFTELSSLILSLPADEYNFISIGSSDVDVPSISNKNPKNFNLVELTDMDCGSQEVRMGTISFIERICEEYNLNCMLASYYPSGGYIGWHTNSNFNIYNAICTFSDTGESYFKFYKDDEEITIEDNIGWWVKKSYWSYEQPILHTAHSNCNRITITFSSKNETDVDNFIQEITAS